MTEGQEKTLRFLSGYMAEKSFPPTITEIQKALGFKNPGYVHKILSYLEKKGYIVRKKGEHRGVRLTELGERVSHARRQPYLFGSNEKS